MEDTAVNNKMVLLHLYLLSDTGAVLITGGNYMDTRVAVIAIIVEKKDSVLKLNSILNDYSDYIIGRMGIPYKPKEINVISIVVDAPQDIISAMSGKIGRLEGISTKTAYSNVTGK